jgi:hypothetical protein
MKELIDWQKRTNCQKVQIINGAISLIDDQINFLLLK